MTGPGFGSGRRPAARCPWAIRFGTLLNTRCLLPMVPSHLEHQGHGVSQFPYQRVHWQAGDRREYLTDRADQFAWEVPQCPVASSVTGVACLLPDGHPQDSPGRFHRYPRPQGGLEP